MRFPFSLVLVPGRLSLTHLFLAVYLAVKGNKYILKQARRARFRRVQAEVGPPPDGPQQSSCDRRRSADQDQTQVVLIPPPPHLAHLHTPGSHRSKAPRLPLAHKSPQKIQQASAALLLVGSISQT